MDPVSKLIYAAIQHECISNKNPHVTYETIVQRLYKKIFEHTQVMPTHNEKTLLFGEWHTDILERYKSLRSTMSHDERAYVERALAKDSPNSTELMKFACCWHKYDATTACKWFAVDGFLGDHPKYYVQEAFAPAFRLHNTAIRALYAYCPQPEKIKAIVEKALLLNENEPCAPDLDPDFERCVGLYAQMTGEEEMKRVAGERRSKSQQAACHKRKKMSA